MSNKIKIVSGALLIGALALVLAFTGTKTNAAEPESVTLTVTAVGKKDMAAPAVAKQDVQFFLKKERTQIADWPRGEKLYLAVLIDDSLDSTVANQWSDLREFFNAQPPSTYISVSYGRNGEAVVAQDFTNDHALAGKALRLPIGPGAFSSPYFEVQDLVKRLPAGERRSILLVSSGIDYFHGNFPTSPDLDTTIEHAQKQNINVWSIYFPDVGHRASRLFLLTRAQSDLSRLAEETGAESFYLGFTAPVTFKPYLDELATHLANQYLLTFKSSGGGSKGRFERVHITTELPNLEFFYAPQVFLPAEK